jgi:hypothetical protein
LEYTNQNQEGLTMTTVAKLAATMAAVFDIEESAVRNKIRAMQDAEILPLAVGRAVPEITPYHLAAAIIGVLGSDKVKDAPKAFNRLHALPDRRILETMPASLKSKIGEPRRLADWLAEQVDLVRQVKNGPDFTPMNSETIYQVIINWPECEVSWLTSDADDAEKVEYRTSKRFRDHGNSDGWLRGCKHSYSFNGVTLARLVWGVFGQANLDD